MAITIQQTYFRNSHGVKWQIIGKFDLDASYPAGGYALDPIQFGLSQIDNVQVNDAEFGYEYNWDAVNSKLRVFESGGGGGGIFTGDPAALTGTNAPSAVTGTADAQVFTGAALANHDHTLVSQNDTGVLAAWRIYLGPVAGGPFTVGETVTGGTSAGTAVVLVQGTNGSGQIYIDLSAIGGVGANLVYNEVITGGTSGATATTRSVLVGRVIPTQPVHNLEAVSASANGITPLDMDFGMVVCPPGVRLRQSFAATYITAENTFEMGADDPDGALDIAAYNIFYQTPTTSAVSAGTPAGTNAASAVAGTAAAQVLTMGPYTPTGTIGGGGGGAPQAEVTPGTNLSAVINVEFVAIGL